MRISTSRISARIGRRRPRSMKLKRTDRKVLSELMRKGRESVRVIKRARILQLFSEGQTPKDAADAVGVALSTAKYIRARYLEGGLNKALYDAPRGAPKSLLNNKEKQQIVAMLCGPSPTGRARWTIRLAAEEVKNRKIVPKVGRETIRVVMSNHELKPWREKNVVRPEVNGRVRGKNGRRPRTLRETAEPA